MDPAMEAERRVQWITRGGYRYLSIDVHAIGDEPTMHATVERMIALMTAEPPASVFTLVDATGTHLVGSQVAFVRDASAAVRPHTRGAAVFGMSTLLRLTFNIVKIVTHYDTMAPFETRAEALAWLDHRAAASATAQETR
jgi:hypothetical protein